MEVRVLNLNIHPYKEKFRDIERIIPAGGEILMDEDEANEFLAGVGTAVNKKDSQGRPDPLYFKKLKIHPDDLRKIREKSSDPSLVCHANGQKYASQAELSQALKTFSHLLAKEESTEDPDLKKVKDLRKENKELKEKLDKLDQIVTRMQDQLGLKEEIAA